MRIRAASNNGPTNLNPNARLRRIRQRAGTLIETLVATCILGVMGGGVLNSVNYGMFTMRLARENERATQIMLERTEAIRLFNWDQITTAGFVPATFTALYDPQTPTSPGVTYSGTMSVNTLTNFAPSYGANMRQVTVTLAWTTAGRINHNRTLSTMVAKDGIQNYVY
jgi:type II secretory pathway pseudopilin PulG